MEKSNPEKRKGCFRSKREVDDDDVMPQVACFFIGASLDEGGGVLNLLSKERRRSVLCSAKDLTWSLSHLKVRSSKYEASWS